jgi:hypothetical protein
MHIRRITSQSRSITKSISKVRHGEESFFVSLIFTDFAVPDTFKALNVLATFSIN